MARWLEQPDPELTADAVRWAVITEDWQALSRIWLGRLVPGEGLRDPEALAQLAQLPSVARSAAPYLSVARALAQAETVDPALRETQVRSELFRDATQLHSQWRQAPDIEGAVQAATLWLMVQRMLPSVTAAADAEAAIATRDEVALAIEQARTEGVSLDRLTEVLFRAASAQGALSRGEFAEAVREAEYAAALDPSVAADVVWGTGALARALAAAPDSAAMVPARRSWVARSFTFGLVAQDLAAERLAAAVAALQQLDRNAYAEARRAIGTVPPGAVRWPVLVYVEAVRDALWGDPVEGLTRLDAAVAVHSMASSERHEVLGTTLIGRARSTLLDRLRAHAAAKRAAAAIPGSWRWVSEARALLWAADTAAAEQVAAAGIFDPATVLLDRLSLRALWAGARVMDCGIPEEERAELVCSVVDECLRHRLPLALAMIPGATLAVMLGLYRSRTGAVSGEDEVLLARLAELRPPARGGPPGPVQLTRRERTLLPLLATSEPVPEIAAGLHVSPHTVRKQVVALRKKFGARNRAELVRLAKDSGWLVVEPCPGADEG